MKPKSRTSYRDPDVVALIAAGGGLQDPRSLVINQARKLNALYRQFEGGTSTPLERLKQLASLKGFEVAPMLLDGRHDMLACFARSSASFLMKDLACSSSLLSFKNIA
jgi:hypothetical protein